MAELISIQTGKIARLGPGRVRSAFVKTPAAGPVMVTAQGLASDEQADKSVHGDAAKAVYAYAAESYAVWRESHPQHDALWAPGGVGENLTTAGLDEDTVCIGDIMRVGDAVLQVTQPREPCFKFALRFKDSLLPKAMMRNGRSGWYYRVLEPGVIGAGAAVSLVERLNPAWPVSRMNRFIAAKRPSSAEIDELAALPGLAETWPPRLGR